METQKTDLQCSTETKNGNEKQTFFNLKLRFNLRQKSTTDKPTIIYCIVRENGKKYAINSGVKVYPLQWDRRKQLAIVSNQLTALDNKNNRIANDRLLKIKETYNNAIEEIKDNPDEFSSLITIFAKYLNYKSMDRKHTKKQTLFTGVLSNINISDKVAKSTIVSRGQALQKLTDYITENKLENAPQTITKKLWNKFSDYLLTDRKANGEQRKHKTVNLYLQHLKTLFRLYNDKYDEETGYTIPTEKFKLLPTVKLTPDEEQTNYIVFDESEIEKLYHTKLRDEKQQTAKDLFLFQCCIGCRVSDLIKIVRGSNGNGYIEQYGDNGTIYINYTSKKTVIKAFTPIDTPTAKSLYDWVKSLDDFPFPVSKDDDTNTNCVYNNTLKQAFRELGYTQTREVYEIRGGEKKTKVKELWSMVHNQLGRHSFITNMYYRGVSADDIKVMSGHKDTRQIDKIYKQLDDLREVQRLDRKLHKTPTDTAPQPTPTTAPTNTAIEQIKQEIQLYKMGFLGRVSKDVQSQIQWVAIHANCSYEKACDILLQRLSES